MNNENPVKYCEANLEPAFDWNKALDAEHISDGEWHDMYLLSNSWVTCACGNQCEIIPRDTESGEPLDNTLTRLGIQFNAYIRIEDAENAKHVLARIEERSAEIIKRILASKVK